MATKLTEPMDDHYRMISINHLVAFIIGVLIVVSSVAYISVNSFFASQAEKSVEENQETIKINSLHYLNDTAAYIKEKIAQPQQQVIIINGTTPLSNLTTGSVSSILTGTLNITK